MAHDIPCTSQKIIKEHIQKRTYTVSEHSAFAVKEPYLQECLYPVPVATELGRVVIYNKGLPSIKSHNPLITWPYEIA